MIKLTREDFYERLRMLDDARRIFIETGLTDNITKAFAAYQEILATENERQPIMISDKSFEGLWRGYLPPIPISRAPDCPECKTKVRFREIHIPKGRGNTNGYRSHFFCEHCLFELYSEKTVEEWYEIFKRHDDVRFVRNEVEDDRNERE